MRFQGKKNLQFSLGKISTSLFNFSLEMAASRQSDTESADDEFSRLKVQSSSYDNRSLDNLNNARGLTPVDSHPLMLQLSPTGSANSADSIEYAITGNCRVGYPDVVPETERNHNEESEPMTSTSGFGTCSGAAGGTPKVKPTSLPLDVVRSGAKKKIPPVLRIGSSSEEEANSQYQATVEPTLDSVKLVASKLAKEGLYQQRQEGDLEMVSVKSDLGHFGSS